MIEELKFLIDQCEDKPKIKELFLKIAALKEDKQQAALDLVKMMMSK